MAKKTHNKKTSEQKRNQTNNKHKNTDTTDDDALFGTQHQNGKEKEMIKERQKEKL